MSDVVAGLLALRVNASFVVDGDSLSLSHTFPLSRHAPPRSRTLLLLVSSLIAHHHSRPLSFSLSRTMATMVGGSQELGGAGVGCGER